MLSYYLMHVFNINQHKATDKVMFFSDFIVNLSPSIQPLISSSFYLPLDLIVSKSCLYVFLQGLAHLGMNTT